MAHLLHAQYEFIRRAPGNRSDASGGLGRRSDLVPAAFIGRIERDVLAFLRQYARVGIGIAQRAFEPAGAQEAIEGDAIDPVEPEAVPGRQVKFPRAWPILATGDPELDARAVAGGLVPEPVGLPHRLHAAVLEDGPGPELRGGAAAIVALRGHRDVREVAEEAGRRHTLRRGGVRRVVRARRRVGRQEAECAGAHREHTAQGAPSRHE
ncbi:hypothetical protein ACQ859_27045 [Roseateles chitinivorans]|uniref:hypothetical protein n=1 Tax=Roseateles chitinivorans TaxID=2917965 RepID=UPI003D67E7EE